LPDKGAFGVKLMRIAEFEPTMRRAAGALAALTLVSLAAGCSNDRIVAAGPASSASASGSAQETPSMTSRVADIFLHKPPQPTPAEKQAAVSNVAETICPPVDVRTGASTLSVPPGSADAFSLRYQGSIGEMARECSVSGGIMRIKVGIEGRVLVGPAGGPGKLDVPLRYAVVKEGVEPKTVVSRFSKIQVTIPEGQSNVIFTHVDNEIAFPMPPGLDIDSYVVYVGFDPMAEKQPPAKKPQAKPSRR
jgi:hypothetical protein